jgi:hypothetical protein
MSDKQHYWLQPCTTVWLFLLLLTGFALGVGKLGLSSHAVMTALLLTTVWKGQLIADHFMALRQAPSLWRFIVWGWLLVVALGVSLAYSF